MSNRQNLTSDEAALAISIFNSAGRLDSVRTDAANDAIFHTNNVVLSNVSGSVVKNVAASLAKHKAARDLILSNNK